ncbi:Uncharacterized protein APZ42_033071 [Daphnia magna]|uniref:Uncharacterized protein n=1 Tax=Daphnia magna TaxID=35525 RepID=A0A164LFH9_9CRUS|nr:Uncharacterized protein APZ42_033071 [Daphnia magna]
MSLENVISYFIHRLRNKDRYPLSHCVGDARSYRYGHGVRIGQIFQLFSHFSTEYVLHTY